MPAFKRYLEDRFDSRGIDSVNALHNMSNIPRDVNSNLRLFLLQWLLNGLATTRRVRHFVDLDGLQPCFLCGQGTDSLEHIVRCEVSCQLADMSCSSPSNLNFVEAWGPEKAAFRWQLPPQEISAILRMNFALWRARSLICHGYDFRDRDDLMHFLKDASQTCFSIPADSYSSKRSSPTGSK